LTAPRTDRATALDRAARYLRSAGLRVLDSDWQQEDGTLDILATHNGALVACVLAFSPRAGGSPPPVSQARQRLARSLAVRWMRAHGLSYARVRVDLIRHVHGPYGYSIDHVREVA
jgi:putative endonuclease